MFDYNRVLITASGSKGVPGLIRDLRAFSRGVYIVTADIDPHAAGNIFADKSYVVSPWNSRQYIPSLSRIIRKEGIGCLIPNDGAAGLMKLCSFSGKNRSLRVAVTPDKRNLAIALDKHSLFGFISSIGLKRNIPDYRLSSSRASLVSEVKRFVRERGKAVVKPLKEEGGRGMKVVCGKEVDIFKSRGGCGFFSVKQFSSLINASLSVPPLLVMEHLPGEEYSVDLLLDPSGKIKYIVPRLREAVSEGVSVTGVIRDNKEVISLVESVLKHLKLAYAVNFQVKYSRYGIPKVIDVNPRVSGGMSMCSRAGVNLHGCLLHMLQEKPMPRVSLKHGTRIYRYYDEQRIFER